MTEQILTDKSFYDMLHKKYICLPNDGILLKRRTKKVVGGLDGNGYIMTRINGKKEGIHRLIYCMVYGYMPNIIYHLNHNPSDNRISNLRDVSHAENIRNSSLSKKNKSGVIGVCFIEKKNRWVATIKYNGQSLHIGSFKNFINAVKARAYAEKQLGYEDYDFLTTASIYLYRINNMVFKINLSSTKSDSVNSVNSEWEFFILAKKSKLDKFVQKQIKQDIKEQDDLKAIQKLNKLLLNR